MCVNKMEPTKTVLSDGETRYVLNGKWHRKDGPALIFTDGSKYWYLNGRCHREDGPAAIWPDGTKEWFLDGLRHREDGPAVIYKDGRKEWWINGIEIISIPEVSNIFNQEELSKYIKFILDMG